VTRSRTAWTSGSVLDVRPLGEDRAEVGEPDQGRAGQVGDRRVDVVGQGQVDEDPVVLVLRRRDGDEVGADEVLGRSGGRHDDVRLGDRVDQPVHLDGAPAGDLGQPLPAGQGPVRDEEAADTTPGGGGGGQAGHSAGADDEHRAAVEVAEQPLRLVEAGLHQGAADRVDPRLVVSALADPKCLLQKGVQRLSDGARALAGAERVAELAEYLRLADRHRVEPGGHREGVGDGAVLEVHVEMRGQLGPVHAADVRERLPDRGDRPVEGERFRIHLEAVARAEDDRLPDRVGRRDPVRESAVGAPATASSKAIGAVRWDRPMTSRLTGRPPRAGRGVRPASHGRPARGARC
jgi:hypothetical protein